MNIGTRIKITGQPVELQGQIGTVVKQSPIYEDTFLVALDSGCVTLVVEHQVEELYDESNV